MSGLLRILAPLLGLPRLEEVDHLSLRLEALHAVGRSAGLAVLTAVLAGAVAWLYLYRHRHVPRRRRAVLALLRLTLFAVLALTLADPQFRLVGIRSGPPRLVWMIDNSDSMNLVDGGTAAPAGAVSRRDRVRNWLRGPGRQLMGEIRERIGAEQEVVLFSGEQTDGLRIFTPDSQNGLPDWLRVDRALTGKGEATSLAQALAHLAGGGATPVASAAVILSDFGHNQGAWPLDSVHPAAGSGSPGPPIYTVGLGEVATRDLAVDMIAPGRMKRGERSTVRIKLSQNEMDGEQVAVELRAQRVEGGRLGDSRVVASRSIRLDRAIQYVEMPVLPEVPGRIRLTASVAAVQGETLAENNLAWQDVTVIDDFLRMTYVAYEPNWEWRFLKEVFYRDPLVGTRGLRTYLDSSAPRLREQTSLFLPTLAMSRTDFFQADVLFLGDMPKSLLTDRFCQMVEEFVGRFGGGLIILAGPRFGPQVLSGTPIEKMLPVVLSAQGRRQDGPEFRPQLTPQGLATPYLQLGSDAQPAQQAWNHLQGLRWYQPSERLHPLGTVLAVHPTDRCVDDQPQPLIATRRYGRGEVIYLAFDETWRLRRLLGEDYYRQFWSQLINHLALGHPLGSEKRFFLRVAQQPFRPGDLVTVELEAYDRQYRPLRASEVPASLTGTVTVVPDTMEGAVETEVAFEYVADGRWEARIPADTSGHWRIEVEDPLGGLAQEAAWSVVARSVERQSAVRNARLQHEIAQASGGRALEMDELEAWAGQLQLDPVREPVELHRPLWQSPAWFTLGLGLLLVEWWCRYRWRLI